MVSIISFPFVLYTFHSSVSAQSSTNYQLKSYGFGSGGVASGSSESFNFSGMSGDQDGQQLSSTNYKANSGLTFTLMANVPPAPTLSNVATNYDRLKFVLDTGGNASDTQFAIQISTDNFVSDIQYIQSDNTIGPTLTNEDWQTYATWGGASGASVTTLASNTTYKVRAKARQGSYTESSWGPTSTGVATSQPTLTFSVSADTVTFSNLNAGNSYTDSSKTTILTTSTNAYNGYVVNARETGVLASISTGTNIPNYTSPNSAPTTWSGTGFGYTTNDNDLIGGTADRFDNATKYAGFSTSSPGDPVANHIGPITTPITDETFTISYRVTATDTTRAGTYTTTLLYIATPEY